MAFVAWAAFCLGVCVALQRRPFVIVVLVVLLWVGVPGIAAAHFAAYGARPPIHPAAVLAVVAVLVLLLTRPSWITRPVLDRPEWSVLLVALSVIAVGVSLGAGAGTDAVIAVVNQILAPAAAFILVGAALLDRPDRIETLRHLVVGVAVAESLLAIAQLVAGAPLVYASDFANLAIVRQGSGRWMGTLDHPLVLSLLLVVALVLLAGVRTRVVLVAAPVILGGVLVTQSRVGLLFSVLGVAYLLLRGRSRVTERLATLVVLAVAGLAAFAVGAGDSLMQRLADDQGSTSARGRALEYFVAHVGDYLWFGQGLNASFGVSESAGLASSFESAGLMYAIDLGVAVAAVYFGLMLWIAVRPLRRSRTLGVAPAAAVVLLVPQTFSALSGTTAAPFIVWFVLALAGFCPLRLNRAAISPSLAVDLARSRYPEPAVPG